MNALPQTLGNLKIDCFINCKERTNNFSDNRNLKSRDLTFDFDICPSPFSFSGGGGGGLGIPEFSNGGSASGTC
jgi:hypothetical protein